MTSTRSIFTGGLKKWVPTTWSSRSVASAICVIGSDEVFEAIWRAQIESNQGIDEHRYKVQAGGIADWAASTRGDPVWDPADIDVPTMVFYGTEDDLADRQGSLACYDRLTHGRSEYVEMAGVDHYMMHGERRQEVFQTVSDFHDRVSQ